MYDDDRDALAAEYVLGTLSADERDQAEALLVIDPGFAEIVRVWERRLGELNVMVEAVEPPTDVWDRIKTEIDGAERRIAAEAEATLPAIEEAAPRTAPETPAEPGEETTPQEPAETMPDLLAEPVQDLDAQDLNAQDLDAQDLDAQDLNALNVDLNAQNLNAAAPEDLDEDSPVSALASSLLLPPEPPDAEPAAAAAPAAGQAGAPKVERSADVIYLARQTRRWRGFTVAMSAIAAVLAVYIAVSQFAPGLLPAGRFSPSAALAPPGSRFVAVLQQEPTAPAFLLTVDPQQHSMTVRRMTAAADAGRSYELWLIAGTNAKPQSLGLVGVDEFTSRPLPADFDTTALRAARYAVSLEPEGGSKSGAPSGPILFTGKMVESVPAPPSPKT
jgi:anti-sigma-K factor RskA